MLIEILLGVCNIDVVMLIMICAFILITSMFLAQDHIEEFKQFIRDKYDKKKWFDATPVQVLH